MRLKRSGTGCYLSADGEWEFQNPHRMDSHDPDRHWYVGSAKNPMTEMTYGPFDTLKEAKEFVDRGALSYRRNK